jgi:DNA ligase-1
VQLADVAAVSRLGSSRRQRSAPGLRFARVKGYRPDKRPADADTIDTVRSLIHR